MSDPDTEGDVGYFQPRVMRHVVDGVPGAGEYAIHDVYFTSDGTIVGYTDAARSPRMGSVAEFRAWIIAAVNAGTPVVCGDLGYTHSSQHFSHWLRYIDETVIDYEP